MCTVQADQTVFAVYAGLTAGGYDIAQTDPDSKIAAVAQEAVYVIVARPDAGPIVHEALHSLFAPALEQASHAVDAAINLYTSVWERMIRMGYAWDSSPASWRRVWEESLIRAATIWAESSDCPAKAASAAEDDADMGFVYVPQLLECFGSRWRGIGVTRVAVSSD